MNRARKPAVFRLDDPGIVVTPSEEPRSIALPPPYPLPQAGEGTARCSAAPRMGSRRCRDRRGGIPLVCGHGSYEPVSDQEL